MNFTNPQKKFIRESRANDYLYDPVYTTSSRRDFFKAASRGGQLGARMQLRPIWKTMFSELMRDRRLEACLKMQRPNVLENFILQPSIKGVPVSPMDTGPMYCREVEVTGADRANFVISYGPQQYRMARPTVEFDMEDLLRKNRKKKRPKGQFISRGAQTDYRESETQTDPYSPPYTLPYPEAYPKVLALIKLTWGKGLPATLEDIVVIERALTKRLMEISSRNLEDDIDFEKRVGLMEELEAQQWADREKELTQIMAQKMDIISKLLMDLKNKILNEHTMKMEKAYDTGKMENLKYLAELKHRYMREERKLDEKYMAPPKQFKRDVVKEYMEYNSQVFAPMARNGPNLDMLYKVPDFPFPQYRNLEDLENVTNDEKFVRKELEFDVDRFITKIRNIKLSSKDRRMERKLNDVYNAFKNELTRKESYDGTSLLKQMMTAATRIGTPTIEGRSIEEDQHLQAVLNLQKILRGRAVQSAMREEIRANMETMLAMKQLHKADPYGLQATFGEVMAMRNLQSQREEQREKQNEVTEITDQLEGETLGGMLDFLDKEMVRLLDERKVHALMIMAERERRMREATEAGNRAKEEDLRRTNDEIFRHIVGIHQGTVDLYLEDIYLETMDRTANNEARLHVQSLARTLNEASYLSMHEGTEDVEEICADIVHSFLVPEMNRIYQRQRMDSLQTRYMDAAWKVSDATFSAHGVVTDIMDSLEPTITGHMARGDAAVEGTQAALEYFIKEAVKIAIAEQDKGVTPRGEAIEVDQQLPQHEESIVNTAEKSQPEEPEEVYQDLKTPSEESTNEPQDEPQDEPKRTPGESDGQEGQVVDESEKPWEPICVHEDMKKVLGGKSIELASGAEVGVKAFEVVEFAKMAVCQIFEETRECVKECLRNCESDDDFEEQELDDDDDEP